MAPQEWRHENEAEGLPEALLKCRQRRLDGIEIREVLGSRGLFAVANHAVFSNHECCAGGGVADTGKHGKQYTIGFGDVFIQVANELDSNLMLVCPGFLGEGAINADSDDIRIQAGVLAQTGGDVTQFLGADAGESQGKEQQNRVL